MRSLVLKLYFETLLFAADTCCDKLMINGEGLVVSNMSHVLGSYIKQSNLSNNRSLYRSEGNGYLVWGSNVGITGWIVSKI